MAAGAPLVPMHPVTRLPRERCGCETLRGCQGSVPNFVVKQRKSSFLGAFKEN